MPPQTLDGEPRERCIAIFRHLEAMMARADAQGRPLTVGERKRFDQLFAEHERLWAIVEHEDKHMKEIEQLTGKVRTLHGRFTAVLAQAGVERLDDLEPDDKATATKIRDQLFAAEDALVAAGGEVPADCTFKSQGRRSQPMDIGSGSGRGGARGGGLRIEARRGNPRLFRNMWPDQPLSSDGWADEREFFATLGRRMADPRFMASASGQQEGVGGDGGFTVPPAFVQRLLDESLEQELIRPMANVIPVNSNTVTIPRFDDLDHSGGTSAGMAGVWLGEAQQATRQKAVIRPLSMRANKLAIFASATSELLEDAPMFEAQFRAKLIENVAWSLDYAFLRGSGVGQPLGILNSPSLISVTAESGQTASTINYANIKKIYSRMHPRSRPRAVWIMHPDVLSFLLSMFATDGSTSSLYPVLQEGTDTDFRIYGRPVYFSEHCPALGSVGDCGLYDISKYLVLMRRNASVAVNMGPGWLSDEVDFRCILRAAGQDSWDKAFSPRTGSTLGWAVAIAARAG